MFRHVGFFCCGPEMFQERQWIMNYRMFSRGAMVLAAAGVLTLAPASAQDPAARPSGRLPRLRPTNAAIPACLEKLTLSPKQQDQIKEIVRDYDADLVVGVEAVRRPLPGNDPDGGLVARRHRGQLDRTAAEAGPRPAAQDGPASEGARRARTSSRTRRLPSRPARSKKRSRSSAFRSRPSRRRRPTSSRRSTSAISAR